MPQKQNICLCMMPFYATLKVRGVTLNGRRLTSQIREFVLGERRPDMVTYTELFALGLLIVAIITLVLQIKHK